MKNKIIFIVLLIIAGNCRGTKTDHIPPEELVYHISGEGPEIEIKFIQGKEHNHPLMAIWIEDKDSNFLQTIYVAESIGKGVFQHGDPSSGKWMPGEIRRPAALPYWSHRRGIRAKDGLYVPDPDDPVPDAYTGPTPRGDFIIKTRLDTEPPARFTVYFEINQSWDWNEFWTNNKYPDNKDYKSSCQPALIYSAMIDMGNLHPEYRLKIIGHSDPGGHSGELFTDLSTITTALEITREINVIIRK